jgi:hypothetical protein
MLEHIVGCSGVFIQDFIALRPGWNLNMFYRLDGEGQAYQISRHALYRFTLLFYKRPYEWLPKTKSVYISNFTLNYIYVLRKNTRFEIGFIYLVLTV